MRTHLAITLIVGADQAQLTRLQNVVRVSLASTLPFAEAK